MAVNEFIDFNTPKGKELLLSLFSFSRGLYSQLYDVESNEKGRGFKDYVYDAIEKHLKGIDGFDPEKGPLDYHLKFNGIRRSIINDLSPARKEAYEEYRKLGAGQAIESNLTSIAKSMEEPFEDDVFPNMPEHDRTLLFQVIEKEINGDEIVQRIYNAIVDDGFNLSDNEEIRQAYELSVNDFNNGRRRLLTILRKVFKKK